MVLKEEQKRDAKQLELTQEAKKVLSDCEHPTEAEVKEADAKRFELLNEASLATRRFAPADRGEGAMHRQAGDRGIDGPEVAQRLSEAGGFRLD